MDFTLIHSAELTCERFEQFPAWAQYYEPGDIELLSGLGVDPKMARDLIEDAGWSDEYWFPIPEGAKIGTFQFEHRRAIFHTSSGKELYGYFVNSGHAIGIFGKAQEWIININLLDLHKEEIEELREDLEMKEGEPILPVQITVPSEGINIQCWGNES